MGVLRGVTSLQLPQISRKKMPAALNAPTKHLRFHSQIYRRKTHFQMRKSMGVYIFNLAFVVVCVLFLSTTIRQSIWG